MQEQKDFIADPETDLQVHHAPRDIHDRIALRIVKFMVSVRGCPPSEL